MISILFSYFFNYKNDIINIIITIINYYQLFKDKKKDMTFTFKNVPDNQIWS